MKPSQREPYPRGPEAMIAVLIQAEHNHVTSTFTYWTVYVSNIPEEKCNNIYRFQSANDNYLIPKRDPEPVPISHGPDDIFTMKIHLLIRLRLYFQNNARIYCKNKYLSFVFYKIYSKTNSSKLDVTEYELPADKCVDAVDQCLTRTSFNTKVKPKYIYIATAVTWCQYK